MKPAVASSPERTRVFRKTHANVCFDERKSTILRIITEKPRREIVKMANHFWVWLTIHGLNCPIPLLQVSRPPETHGFLLLWFFFFFSEMMLFPNCHDTSDCTIAIASNPRSRKRSSAVLENHAHLGSL